VTKALPNADARHRRHATVSSAFLRSPRGARHRARDCSAWLPQSSPSPSSDLALAALALGLALAALADLALALAALAALALAALAALALAARPARPRPRHSAPSPSPPPPPPPPNAALALAALAPRALALALAALALARPRPRRPRPLALAALALAALPYFRRRALEVPPVTLPDPFAEVLPGSRVPRSIILKSPLAFPGALGRLRRRFLFFLFHATLRKKSRFSGVSGRLALYGKWGSLLLGLCLAPQ
jgi:hypothetical protein